MNLDKQYKKNGGKIVKVFAEGFYNVLLTSPALTKAWPYKTESKADQRFARLVNIYKFEQMELVR